ncbi:MAG: hypothetical protein ACK46Q_10240, partial [Hyphomonas sp.]
HRLVMAGLDADYNIMQEVYSWPIGVPAAITQEQFDTDIFPELMVISPTSPQAIVFEVEDRTAGLLNPLDGLNVLKLDPPRFAEIGLGATLVLSSMESHGQRGTTIAYPEKGQISYFINPLN